MRSYQKFPAHTQHPNEERLVTGFLYPAENIHAIALTADIPDNMTEGQRQVFLAQTRLQTAELDMYLTLRGSTRVSYNSFVNIIAD
jgi:hypothetical protein